MDILILILEAFLVWVLEKSADGILTWLMKQLKSETRRDREIHPPEFPHPTEYPETD